MLRQAIAVRPQQQGRALPARPAPAADGARRTRRGSELEIAERLPGGRASVESARLLRAAAVLAAAACAVAVAPRASGPRTPARLGRHASSTWPSAAGLRLPSVYGGLEQKRFIIETNGAGVAFLDYDGDGWLDALVLSGTRLRDGARADARGRRARRPTNRLYRNNRDGTFADVTDARRPAPHGLGLRRSAPATTTTTAGWTSSSPTSASNVLYRNRGDGRFEDVTASAGLAAPGARWGSGCSFLDYDRDGRLDLFVAELPRVRPRHGARARARARTACGRASPSTAGPRACPPTRTCSSATRATARSRTSRSASGVARVTGPLLR